LHFTGGIMVKFRRILLLLSIVLAGCATQPAADDPYVAFARHYFELLQQRNYDAVEAKLDPEFKSDPNFKSEDLKALFAFFAIAVPQERPLSSKVTAYQPHGKEGTTVTIEYQFPNTETKFDITMRGSGENIVVRHFNVHSDFDLKGDAI
jgi:hypothetical protein